MSATEEQIASEMTPDEDTDLQEQEGDHDDENPEPEQDAPEAAAAAPPTEKQIEARMRALEKQADKHAAAVAKIMGDDFSMLVPSPVDWTPGFIFNVPGMLPSPEAVAELDAILGRAGGIEYLEAKDAERCEDCAGLGEVLTGSRKDGQITKPCTACAGTGWKTKSIAYAPPAAVQTMTNGSATGGVIPNQPIVADRWGRQYGHRDYGLDPSLVNA